jgi:hypothetical protein
MPNYVENDLYVCGDPDKVADFLAAVGADKTPPDFDFNAAIPYPEVFATRDKEAQELGWKGLKEKYGADATDGFNAGGYEWCKANWGTKWTALRVLRRDKEVPCITFETAWNPPMPVIHALHAKFPDLTLHFEYFESGMQFCGGFTLRGITEAAEYREAFGTRSCEWTGKYDGHRGG